MPDPTQPNPAAEISRILGANVRQANPKWLQLMREGVIVRLHVRRWRAKAKLNFADLGLPVAAEDARAFEDLLHLGEKRLLPAEIVKELEAIESAGRKCLERNAYTTFWGPLVAVTNYDAWKAENDSQRERYLAARDRLIEAYDATIDGLLIDYERAARAAYRRMNALAPEQMTRDEYRDEYYFVRAFVARIRALIPSAAQIGQSFAWETELEYIPLPSLLAEEQAQADRIKSAREIERAAEDLQKESLWRDISIEEGAARERQNMLQRMNQDVVAEARRRKQELVDGFLSDLVKQLRGLVYESCVNVLEAMQANEGKLGPRSVVQLRNLTDQISRLNFFDDAEMSAAAAQVRAALGANAETRSARQIAATLRDIATVARATLIDLAAEPRTARAVGIDDEPPAELVRAARGRLTAETVQAAELVRAAHTL